MVLNQRDLRDRLLALLRFLNGKDPAIFLVLLILGACLTGARIVAPFEVGNDQGVQLEVAQRLVEGLGLTTTKEVLHESYDISAESPASPLRDWPPGFSLLVAAFLYVGLPLLGTLKIIYATTTLLGWAGWAVIASRLIARPSGIRKAYSFAFLIIVALLPVFFTPRWNGTDIFLWAGVPFVFIGLFGVGGKPASLLSIGLSGLLSGCLYAMRFASLFLVLGAASILFQVSYPQIRTFLKRFAVFFVSALTIGVPVTIYLSPKTQPINDPAGLSNVLEESSKGIGYLLDYILTSLSFTSNLILGHPLLVQILSKLNTNWLLNLVGIISLLIILAWPFFLWRNAQARGFKVKDDLALGLSFLPISLVIFLMALGLTVNPYLPGISRYYEPVALVGIFIFCEIAFQRATSENLKKISKVFLFTFVLYVGIYLPGLSLTSQRKDSLVINILGFTPSRTLKYQSTSQQIDYPSLTIYSGKESTRAKVKQLHQDDPQALFYANEYGYFVYDGFKGGPPPGASFRAFRKADFWRHAWTGQSIKVFWVLDQKISLDFIPVSNQKLIFSDPFERMKILASDFPAGPIVTEEHAAENQ